MRHQDPILYSPDSQSPTSTGIAPDRRQHRRYTVQVQIEIHPEGSDVPLRLETTDISRGGCYVQLLMPLELHTLVRATLWLDGYPIGVRGQVVTRHPQFGNGISWLQFEGEGEQLLRRYLQATAI